MAISVKSAGRAAGALSSTGAPIRVARRAPHRAAAEDDAVVEAALVILRARLRSPGVALDGPSAVRRLLWLSLVERPRECFLVLFLDGQHRLIADEVLFEGTLTETSVYPREVARRSLELNAAAVVLAHNHPSGCSEPSVADRYLTERLKSTLAVVDVRVLDHFIVGHGAVMSLAERGEL